MKTVKNILEQKGGNIHIVTPDMLVYDAIRVMGEQNIGSVLVMVDGKMVGILTERDYARKVVLHGKFSATTFVHEIMTPHPGLYTVEPGTSIEECMHIMTQHNIRHLPVVEAGEAVGMISMRDVVFTYINHQKEIIEGMTSFLYR